MSSLSSSASSSSPETYFDLGKYTRCITTQNEDAQLWFDRGLIWTYSFNHDEACKCFRLALHHDPHCAMAYWGLAYAAEPNYNKTWMMFDSSDLRKSVQRCHSFAKKAKELANSEDAKPVERALIDAIQARFPTDGPATDSSVIEKAYAEAMQVVYDKFGSKDLDVTALYVDALMQTAPRKLYHVRTGLPIEGSPVHKVRAVFDRAFQHPECDTHPGILHFWIHFMEMSCTPGAALPGADKLRHLVPDAGHTHHMPTHLDVLVGDYRRAVDSNTAATIADEKYFAMEGGKNFYSYYRLHNYHSLIYATMISGQVKVALEALENMERSITDELLRVESPPLADWMEFFKAVRVHVYIRFGKWEEIKRLPIPGDQSLYCVTTTMFHYGKSIAWAATGCLEQADKHRELYHAAATTIPPTRKDFPNLITDILRVATAMLAGEIEYRRQNYDVAFRSFREAIQHDDALRYTEPWGWMVPTRNAYAALLLEQGRVEEAAKAYAEDLGLDGSLTRAHQHPNNVWALHGYHECLLHLGRDPEAHIIKQQLDLALLIADVPISSSCFCCLEKSSSSNGKSCHDME